MQAEKYERLFGEPRISNDDSQIEEGQIGGFSKAIEVAQSDIGLPKKKNRSKDGIEDESKSLIKRETIET